MTSKTIVENHLSDQQPKWFAVYTRFKAEKEVVRRLQGRGIEAYVPLSRVVRQYVRKRRVVEKPLINCYVFTKITKPQYVRVLETANVIKFVKFSQNLVSIPDAEIDLLKRICQEQMEVEALPTEFVKGQPVEIIGGGLTGIHGKLVEDRGKNFVVQLEHIGFGLHMELDPSLLRAIGPRVEEEEEVMVKKYW